MRQIIYFLLLVSPLAWGNADYARERKWADEIMPSMVVGEVIFLEARKHAFLGLYTAVANAKAGLIIVHGSGVHPDHGLIGVLRRRLADAGYTTLSIQMPILAPEVRGDPYYPLHPEAAERIDTTLRFLQSKGLGKVALVSHSQGSRMSHSYFKAHPQSPLRAWVSIGISGKHDYTGLNFPVLDLFGEMDLPVVLEGAAVRAKSLAGHPASRQIIAPKMDHFFTGYDEDLVGYVKAFLGQVL